MCYPSSGVLSTCELLSVDSLLAIINQLYSHCDPHAVSSSSGSHDHSEQPTPEDLLLLRQRKKVTNCNKNQIHTSIVIDFSCR